MNRKKLSLIATVLVLAAGLLAGQYFTRTRSDTVTAQAQASDDSQRRHTVRTAPVARRPFERSLAIQGNVKAQHFANIPARVSGTLDDVFVDEGDSVEKGFTKLFQVDRENLKRAVLIAEQDLAVSQCSQRESEANLERIEADLRKAKLDYDRFTRLVTKDAATEETLEQQQSRYEQVVAMRKHAAAIIDLNRQRVRQAEIAVEVAQKDLSDSVVVAPINGEVVHRLLEPGEMAQPGNTVLRIENVSALEVCAFLPAQYYALVDSGQTEMEISAAGERIGSFPVVYKSPTIDDAHRTFEVRCLLNNLTGVLAPGAMVEAKLAFERHDGLGVPRDSVQIRNGQTVVFTIEGERARMVPVATGLISNGWAEVSDGALAEGAAVVSAGQYMLDDGVRVNVQREAD